MQLPADGGQGARAIAILSELLDRHRGAGQQQIAVKHVTVNADKAIVGDLISYWEGHRPKSRINPMLLDMQSSPRCGAKDPQRDPLPSPGNAEREMQDARRPVSGRPERE